MNLHLAEISTRVTPGRHAVLVVDQAGWHVSERLIIPANITIVPLPAKCPELNPQENIWQFLRDNWLSNGCSLTTTPSSTTAATLEQAREATLEDYVHRFQELGPGVLIIERWYHETCARVGFRDSTVF